MEEKYICAVHYCTSAVTKHVQITFCRKPYCISDNLLAWAGIQEMC